MKSFLKLLLAAFIGGVAALALLFFAGALVVGAGALGVAAQGALPERAFLVVELAEPVADGPRPPVRGERLESVLAGARRHPLRLWEITRAIRRAAEDERVCGILLRGNVARSGVFSGWPALAELRSALEGFAASGKPVRAYQSSCGEPEYYLASAAGELWLDPAGTLRLDGFASERTYFADTLERIGVEVQVARVGRYKSAVEPFVLGGRSEADREQTRELLLAFQETFHADAARSRGLDPATLEAVTAQGDFVPARRAVELGLADAALDHAGVLAALDQLGGFGGDGPTTMGLTEYARSLESRRAPRAGHVAVVYAEGDIVDGEGGGGSEVGGDALARLLRELRDDEEVAAVVLRVNSPGGSALASELVGRELVRLREKKRVVCSLGTVAASGGYWIACQADRIVAHPHTVTGSIGVFGMKPSLALLLAKVGLSVDVVKTAEHADAMSFHRPLTPVEMEMLETLVERIYEDFLERVAAGRKLAPDDVRALAEGRVWSGVRALELGLVDRLGGLDEAIALAAELAGLEGEPALRFPQLVPPGFLDLFLEGLFEGERRRPPAVRAPSAAGLEVLRAAARELDRAGAAGLVRARLPYDLFIR